jgi:zinc/manganese transport system substrate-binding protein
MVFNIVVNKMALLLVPLLAAAGALAACGSGSGGSGSGASGGASGSGRPTTSGVVNVVAGENFWGDIVRQLGGAHVHVTSIISDPNADPHEYESDAKNAAAIARADVVVENGLGYDDFMDKLLSASPRSSRDVLSVAKILNVAGSNPNPHIWYDTARLPQVAAAIVAELSRRDPADAATFGANETTFVASLNPLLSTIATIKAKYAGAAIAYTERVPGYLIDAAGLKLGIPSSFAQAIEDGNDPSPADTAAFDTALKSKSVKVLLYNGQVTDPTTDKIKALAKSSGVPIVGVTETLPSSDKTFQAWQLRQDRELLQALGG